jgi:hypothetical protein
MSSRFRAWSHYQQQLPRSREFGKEDSNLHRLIQSQGAFRLADSREHPAGVEPACQIWKIRALPTGPGCVTDPKRFILKVTPLQSLSRLLFTSFPLFPSVKSSLNVRRKEGESNPQGSSLARVRVGCRRQSACPSGIDTSSSTGGRSRTSNRRLNRAPPYR